MISILTNTGREKRERQNQFWGKAEVTTLKEVKEMSPRVPALKFNVEG